MIVGIEVFKARKFLFCDGSKSEALAEAVGAENLENQMGTAPGVAGGEAYLRFIADYQSQFGELATVPLLPMPMMPPPSLVWRPMVPKRQVLP